MTPAERMALRAQQTEYVKRRDEQHLLDDAAMLRVEVDAAHEALNRTACDGNTLAERVTDLVDMLVHERETGECAATAQRERDAARADVARLTRERDEILAERNDLVRRLNSVRDRNNGDPGVGA